MRYSSLLRCEKMSFQSRSEAVVLQVGSRRESGSEFHSIGPQWRKPDEYAPGIFWPKPFYTFGLYPRVKSGDKAEELDKTQRTKRSVFAGDGDVVAVLAIVASPPAMSAPTQFYLAAGADHVIEPDATSARTVRVAQHQTAVTAKKHRYRHQPKVQCNGHGDGWCRATESEISAALSAQWLRRTLPLLFDTQCWLFSAQKGLAANV